jgi:hypothetical protein
MQITIKKSTFEAEIRNSMNNLNTRFEWFMKWKDTNLDYKKYCVFINYYILHLLYFRQILVLVDATVHFDMYK